MGVVGGHGSNYSILGLYRDNGKENGNYYNIIGYMWGFSYYYSYIYNGLYCSSFRGRD